MSAAARSARGVLRPAPGAQMRRTVHQALSQAATESYPEFHCAAQDHGAKPEVCRGAIDLGFSSVMMDGSLQADGKTISSFDYNVEVTRKVVDMAHAQGVTVEGELGCLGSLETMKGDKEDGHGTEATMTMAQLLTDPRGADSSAPQLARGHCSAPVRWLQFTRKPTVDSGHTASRKSPRASEYHLVRPALSVPQDLLATIRESVAPA